MEIERHTFRNVVFNWKIQNIWVCQIRCFCAVHFLCCYLTMVCHLLWQRIIKKKHYVSVWSRCLCHFRIINLFHFEVAFKRCTNRNMFFWDYYIHRNRALFVAKIGNWNSFSVGEEWSLVFITRMEYSLAEWWNNGSNVLVLGSFTKDYRLI